MSEKNNVTYQLVQMETLTKCYIQVQVEHCGLLKFYIPRLFINGLYKLIFEKTHMCFKNISASVKTRENYEYLTSIDSLYFKTAIIFYNNRLFKSGETCLKRCVHKHPENIRDIEIFKGNINDIVSTEGYTTGPFHII